MTGPISAKSLVEPGRVHRRVYADPDIFEMEMDRIFGRAWIFVAHESQLRRPGDFLRAGIGREPLLVVRGEDGEIRVMRNRCLHRGMLVCIAGRGNVDRFACPYHGWVYGRDGRLLGVPQPDGYASPRALGGADAGLAPVARTGSYRGFVFASLAKDGPDLRSFLGPAAKALDNLVDRAPQGEIELAGGGFRQDYPGNWKLHIENANDLVHPTFVHDSSIGVGRDFETGAAEDPATQQALQMYAANGIPLSAMSEAGTRGFARGHSYIGGFYESGMISAMPDTPEFNSYRELLAARLGAGRADAVLGWDTYNHLIYPNLVLNPRFQSMRVVEPVAVDRTIAHSFCFRLKGAPEWLYESAVRFLTTLNSPASLIATDDLEIYSGCQTGFAAAEPEWINLEREEGRDRPLDGGGYAGSGTSELPIRTQYRAWLDYMQSG